MYGRYGQYAIVGDNGLGVLRDYNKALSMKKYFVNFECKRFRYFADAQRYAIKMYNSRQVTKATMAYVEDFPNKYGIVWRKDITKE